MNTNLAQLCLNFSLPFFEIFILVNWAAFPKFVRSGQPKGWIICLFLGGGELFFHRPVFFFYCNGFAGLFFPKSSTHTAPPPPPRVKWPTLKKLVLTSLKGMFQGTHNHFSLHNAPISCALADRSGRTEWL